MIKNRKISGLILLYFLAFSSSALADLIDEDDTPASHSPSDVEMRKDPSVDKIPPKKLREEAEGVSKTAPQTKAAGGKLVGKEAKKSAKKGDAKAKVPVHFESKGLKGLREKGLVELVDNVVVTQGDFRLEADKAQVFFDESAHDVVKVIAEGNVKIFNIDENTGEKLKAYANQVVFLNKERRVIMEGNARLWRGEESVIRGKKITYEMDTGWIRADRVAGELAPSEKDKK